MRLLLVFGNPSALSNTHHTFLCLCFNKGSNEEAHLAGAINIPLSKLDQKTTTQLQKDQPVITYCNDYQ